MPDEENDVEETSEDTDEEHEADISFGEDEDSEEQEEDDSEQEDSTDDEEEEEVDWKARYEAEKEEYEKRIREQNAAAYKARKKIQALEKGQKPDEDEGTLTDAQLTKIIEEHGDDPSVMMQVFKQIAKQESKDVKQDAQAAVEISQTQKNLDNFLVSAFPDYAQEDSETRGQVEEWKPKLKLDDHPFGDFLTIAAGQLMSMPQIIEAAKEEGKREALGEKSETARKDSIKKKSPSQKGKKSSAKSVETNDNIEANIKQMGLTGDAAKLYRKMMLKSKKGQPMTVEV